VYFVLAGAMERFTYLSQGLAVMLAFIGTKMILAQVIHIPTVISLGTIVMIIVAAILLSVWKERRLAAAAAAAAASPPAAASSPAVTPSPAAASSPAARAQMRRSHA